MKQKRLWTVTAAAGLLLAAHLAPAPAFSQEHRQRARVRENILTLRLMRMTQALDLSREQTARIYPELMRLENEKAELQALLAERIIELRALVLRDVAAEADIIRVSGAVRRLREDIRSKDREIEAFLDEQLEPVQRAKYILFTIDFFRGLGEKVDRARGPAPRVKRKQMF